MSKHVLDNHATGRLNRRLGWFTRYERETGATGPHATTSELQRRAKARSRSNALVRAFLRIDRTGQ